MDDLSLLIDLHRLADRQGPGGEAQTRLAIELAGLAARRDLKLADIGCGTGASTLVLARELDARVSAVDLIPDFLAILQSRAAAAGLASRIDAVCAAMDALPFHDASLDVIWSEGAVYNIGFESGVRAWRRCLRPGGILAVSELTWLTARRPEELEAHWRGQYPEVGPASDKVAVLERAGYAPLGYFVLPEHCWLDAYYRPLQRGFAGFLARHDASDAAQAVVAAEAREIALYERYRAHVGYGFYIARKIDDGP